ncbi:hypothetical protein Q8A73_011723 [Channa argus]|nr:hypothetical protein Q8A73_011723 [Channa argus]
MFVIVDEITSINVVRNRLKNDMTKELNLHAVNTGLYAVAGLTFVTTPYSSFQRTVRTSTQTSGPLRETLLCYDRALYLHPHHQTHQAGLALNEPPLKLEMHTRELAVTRGPGEDHIDLTRMLRPSKFLTRGLVYGNRFAHLTF